jgi:PAS domain S-box-containing protein
MAFCDHAIRSPGVMVVPDAGLDPRFSGNPLVTGAPHIRFYAGAPLVTPDGFALGTICAIDRVPRQLSPCDTGILQDLAEQVMHELEVRAALGELYRDVAEGRRAARTLQSDGARLEALLNATGNAVVTADSDGQVTSVNRAAEAMFEFAPGEAIGRPMDRLISIDARASDGDSRRREGLGWRNSGAEFPIEVSDANWIDAQGRPAHGVILRDITARRRAEAELRHRDEIDRNHDKLAALGRTAGGVAHELNNLLQPVIGLTELELDALPVRGTPAQDDSRENLAIIMDCGKQMTSIVRKILMFSRKSKPERTAADFPAVLGRTLAFVRNLMPPGIRLAIDLPDSTVGLATINEAELVEVITNLVMNAAHAMNNTGTVSAGLDRIELARPEAKPLGLGAGAYFRITVADTGHGMDDATKAQIFEPFFTTKPIGEGTGLGLSMTYGVIHDWNGAIAIDSAVGVGTTFTLYVPVTTP